MAQHEVGPAQACVLHTSQSDGHSSKEKAQVKLIPCGFRPPTLTKGSPLTGSGITSSFDVSTHRPPTAAHRASRNDRQERHVVGLLQIRRVPQVTRHSALTEGYTGSVRSREGTRGQARHLRIVAASSTTWDCSPWLLDPVDIEVTLIAGSRSPASENRRGQGR